MKMMFKAVLAATALTLTLSQPVFAEGKPQNSKAAGKVLKTAIDAYQKKNWAECVSQARAADATPGRNEYDSYTANELLMTCGMRSGDSAGAARAIEANMNSPYLDKSTLPSRIRGLAQIAFQQKNYPKAIEYGQKAMSSGYGDGDTVTLISQAYYVQGEYRKTLNFLDDNGGKGANAREIWMQLMLSSCVKLNDDKCTTAALERLVARFPKGDYWKNLMSSLMREGGSDAVVLNIYRLAAEVGTMNGPQDYNEMAQLAIDQGLPGEAQAMLELGQSRNVFVDKRDIERNTRLLTSSKTAATADKATLAKLEALAAAQKTGQADVKLGTAYISYGMYPQAIAAIKRGIEKGGVKNPAEAQLSLGIALFRSGDKDGAAKVFKETKGDPTMERLGKLWALRSQQ